MRARSVYDPARSTQRHRYPTVLVLLYHVGKIRRWSPTKLAAALPLVTAHRRRDRSFPVKKLARRVSPALSGFPSPGMPSPLTLPASMAITRPPLIWSTTPSRVNSVATVKSITFTWTPLNKISREDLCSECTVCSTSETSSVSSGGFDCGSANFSISRRLPDGLRRPRWP